jgi:hypothetical protein
LHLFKRYKAIETGAYSSNDGAFVIRGIISTGRISAGNGRNVERIGIRMIDGLDDVAHSHIDQRRRERWLWCRSLLWFGSLFLLLLLLPLLSRFSDDGILDLPEFPGSLVLC